MRTATIAAILLLGLTTAPVRADGAATLREKFDVRYFASDDTRHVADIYTPVGDKPAPVFVFAHGGAWVLGDKNFFGLYRGVGRWIAKQGFVVVAINYRLSPSVQHPEHGKDLARAYAWVRQHIKEYGGDPDRIVLGGHSAGGHMSTLVGTCPDFLCAPELKLTDADRAALKGVVGISGVYRIPDEKEFMRVTTELVANFTGMQKLPGLTGKALGVASLFRPKSQDINPLRVVFGTDKAAYAAASPLTHVRKDLPPMLLLYAGLEIPPLDDQAVEYAEKLRTAGVDVTLEKMHHADHNSILMFISWKDNPTGKVLIPFLKRVTEARK